jgi:hypothetical protein
MISEDLTGLYLFDLQGVRFENSWIDQYTSCFTSGSLIMGILRMFRSSSKGTVPADEATDISNNPTSFRGPPQARLLNDQRANTTDGRSRSSLSSIPKQTAGLKTIPYSTLATQRPHPPASGPTDRYRSTSTSSFGRVITYQNDNRSANTAGNRDAEQTGSPTARTRKENVNAGDPKQRRSLFGLKGMGTNSKHKGIEKTVDESADQLDKNKLCSNNHIPLRPVSSFDQLNHRRPVIEQSYRSHARQHSASSLPPSIITHHHPISASSPLSQIPPPVERTSNVEAEIIKTNSGLFPWSRSRSRLDSPNSSQDRSPADKVHHQAEEVTKGFFDRPDQDKGSIDDSFQIRGFRHVSGGSGRSPLASPLEIEAAAKSADAHRRRPNTNLPPRLSRPPSFAGSIAGDEPAKQVSVQMFKQARRQSTSSVFTLEAYRLEDEEDNRNPSSSIHEPSQILPVLRRVSTQESGMEMLASPERRQARLSDVKIDDRIEGLDESTQIQSFKPLARNSASNGKPSISSPTTLRSDFGSPIPGSSGSLIKPGYLEDAPPHRQPQDVSYMTKRLETQSVTSFELAEPVQSIKNHNRSWSASLVPAPGVARDGSDLPSSSNSPVPRPSLHERLASATVSTPPAQMTPSTSGCLIPPVELVPKIKLEPHSAMSRPVSHRNQSSRSGTKRSTPLNGWASSSEEESDGDQHKTAQSGPRPLRNLPSGIRRPPPPSEAFGQEIHPSPSKSGRPLSTKQTGSPMQSTYAHRSSFSSARRATGIPSSSSSESEGEASSSDESLAAVAKKQSKRPLGSKLSHSTPDLSTSLQPQDARFNRKLLPVSTPSAGKSTTEWTSKRALPTPPSQPNTAIYLHVKSNPYESPPSSQSGTTADASSRVGPLTPQEMPYFQPPITLTNDVVDSTSPPQSRSRRVSFIKDSWPTAGVEATKAAAEDKHRNERRRAETAASIQVRHISSTDADHMLISDILSSLGTSSMISRTRSWLSHHILRCNLNGPRFRVIQYPWIDICRITSYKCKCKCRCKYTCSKCKQRR